MQSNSCSSICFSSQRKDNTKKESKIVNGEEYVKLSAKDFHQGILTGMVVLDNLKYRRYMLPYKRLVELRDTTKELLDEMKNKKHFDVSLSLIHHDIIKECFKKDYEDLIQVNEELLLECEMALNKGRFIVDDEFLVTMDAKNAFEQLVKVAKRELEEGEILESKEKKKRKETTIDEVCTCPRDSFFYGYTKKIGNRLFNFCGQCNKIRY